MSLVRPQDGIVIVTGAGSGLGRALAQRLCAEGFTVAGIGRREAELEETATLCSDGLFLPSVLDVADSAAVTARFAELVATHGPVAILINNAAVNPHRDFLDESGDSFMHSVAVNLGGVVNCTRAVLDDMGPRGAGRILNVATFADLAPLPAASAYSVSKGAARILTRALVADLGDRLPGIVIGDWMPGMLRTGMGIPDGLPPERTAEWGVKLARMRDPSLSGAVFERDREVLPPRGLKRRLKDALLLRRRKPRVLD